MLNWRILKYDFSNVSYQYFSRLSLKMGQIKQRPGRRTYSPELVKEHDEAIALANQAYVLQDYQQCISFSRRAITAFPSSNALELLYRVHIDKGLKKRAMDFRYIQALLEKHNLDLWQELLAYYRSLTSEASSFEITRLTISIIRRIVSIYLAEKWDIGAKSEEFLHLLLYQASLFIQVGEGTRATQCYQRILNKYPLQVEATAELSSLTYRLGNPAKAIQYLDTYIANAPKSKTYLRGEETAAEQIAPENESNNTPARSDLPAHLLHIASIRAEIQNETGKFVEAIDGIESFVNLHGFSLFSTPTLYARWIVAKALLSSNEAHSYADTLVDCMEQTPRDALLDSTDLLYDTANIFLRCNAPTLALIIFEKLVDAVRLNAAQEREKDAFSQNSPASPRIQLFAALHLGIACCHRDLHNAAQVEDHLGKVLLYEPCHVDTLCMLAEHKIHSCYATANGDQTKEASLIKNCRDEIIDLLSPKPETDAVLSLRLLSQRAKFYVFHDKSNVNSRALALADLLEIVQAALRDSPVSTIVGGILNAEAKRERKGTESQVMYPSSTLTMTQVVDGSIIGTGSFAPNMSQSTNENDQFFLNVASTKDIDSVSMASQSVVSTFRWESRPSDRPRENKAVRFQTDSIRSTCSKRGQPTLSQSRAPSSVFKYSRTKNANAPSQVRGSAPSIIADEESTAGSVGNLEDLAIFDELLGQEMNLNDLGVDAPHEALATPTEGEAGDVQCASKTILHWVDVQIAFGREEDILSAFLLFFSLITEKAERFYWVSKIHAARRITKPLLRQKIELELFNSSIQMGNEAVMVDQLARLLRFQTEARTAKTLFATSADEQTSCTVPPLWNAMNDILKRSSFQNVMRRLTRYFFTRYRVMERQLCLADFGAQRKLDSSAVSMHIERVFPFLIVLGNMYSEGFVRVSGRWSLLCYYRALAINPHSSLLLLCVAAFYARLCRQRRCRQRYEEYWRACWYFALQHRQCAEKDKGELGWLEGTYNLGRIAQQLAIPHIAVQCYKAVLRSVLLRDTAYTRIVPGGEGSVEKIDGLRRYAAYNLHVIYRNAGNLDLAFATLMEHISI
ncbi:hypothetical protein XU18_4317 [Perkinsela sp. CCAP 1560/4]|nr:hypothetical protein XU18_4317 [Perkinsela sp. CCAP 1560/4]|eukprot:KNH04458.1 hypothetical protein XU18_4317 [Perkinsela sp. CCAP 1560/4]